jgi:hypothetical protein
MCQETFWLAFMIGYALGIWPTLVRMLDDRR